jgi:hypothetical protein
MSSSAVASGFRLAKGRGAAAMACIGFALAWHSVRLAHRLSDIRLVGGWNPGGGAAGVPQAAPGPWGRESGGI